MVRVRVASALLISAVLAAGCGGGAEEGTAPSATVAPSAVVKVTNIAQAAPLTETVIASQPSLQKLVPAKFTPLQVNGNPAALAGMKSGVYDIVTEVGAPPVVTALLGGIDVKVIWAEVYDHGALVVDSSVHQPADMAGKTFGTRVGTSEDYSFRGWLTANHLLDKVELVNLEQQPMAAAFKRGSIAGGFNEKLGADQMVQAGGKVLTTSKDINEIGYPSINMVVVESSYAAQHPDVVRGYVCALRGAYKLMTGPTQDDVFRKGALFQGEDPEQGRMSAKSWPLFDPKDELTPAGLGNPGAAEGSDVVKSLYLTAQSLKQQGVVPRMPSLSELASHVDTSFAEQTVNASCQG